MKKIFFLLLVNIFMVVIGFSQPKLNAFVAVNYGTSSIVHSPASTIGFSYSRSSSYAIGSHITYEISEKLRLSAMPMLKQLSYKYFAPPNHFDVRATYINVPLNIEWSFSLGESNSGWSEGFFVGVGAYAGFALGGKYRDLALYAIDTDFKKIKIGESPTDQRSATDFGLNFTLGWQYKSIRLGLQKLQGLKNVVPSARQAADGNNKIRDLSFFVAYSPAKLFKKK